MIVQLISFVCYRSEESEFQRWVMSDKTTSEIISYLDSLPLSSLGNTLITILSLTCQTVTHLQILILDLELQSLAPQDGGGANLVERFIEIMTSAVQTKQYYDVVQAYLNVFLKVTPCCFSSLLFACLHKHNTPQYNRQYLVDTPHLHDKLSKLKSVQSGNN